MVLRETKLAGKLQEKIRDSEQRRIEEGLDYSQQEVRIATVHTREDVTMLVSYMDSINKNLRRINSYLSVLVIIALVIMVILLV